MLRSSRRVIILGISLLTMAFLISVPGIHAAKTYRVALIVKNLVNPFWNYMKQGAEEKAKELGIEVVTLAPTKPDNLEEQIRIVEDCVQKRLDAIVLVPVDSKGIIPAIETANRAGIPVVTANTRAFGGKVVTFVGVENYDAAYRVGKFALEKIGGKGKVIILEGVPGAQTAIDRKAGFDAILKEFPNVKVLTSQPAKFQRAEGMLVMENLLQRYPDVDLVLAANDEMALGAIEAIDAAGKLGKIMVAGFDGNKDAMQSIAQGRLAVTFYQDPQAQAGMAVEAAINYIKGKQVPDRIVVPGELVDKNNVDKFLKLYGLVK
ncbi:MAG TPA: sugar ABC transporter substrate-binding protein [Firmicutes bacterium]|nr:sugar ABC transporter substrate-binding protein [Bacillota bacterium]